MSEFTHKGVVQTGHWSTERTVKLRETKTLWVDDDGKKFRKATGSLVGGSFWNTTRLKINTIVPIEY